MDRSLDKRYIETYITSRVKETIGVDILSFLLKQVDKIPSQELDYLQIFHLQRQSSFILVEHKQEVPPRKSYYYLVDRELQEADIKLYLIYENDYRVLMYSNEY